MSFFKDYPFDEISEKLNSSLRIFLDTEYELFHFEVNERTLTQHLSFYLHDQFSKQGLNVDCEYNRRWKEDDG